MYADGWIAPTLKSKWSSNPRVNQKTLQNELGFNDDGMTYGVYQAFKTIQVFNDGSKSEEVKISFRGWRDSNIEQSYRIPIVAKEVFKLYFGKDADRVWNYFNRNDIPEKFTANGRTVKAQFIENSGTLSLSVGYKK